MTITDSALERPSIVGGGSVYPAVQNFLLACRNEGLGCVLTTLLRYEEDAVKRLLNLPEDWHTCAHIPVGYPVLGGHGKIRRRPVEKMVRFNEGNNLKRKTRNVGNDSGQGEVMTARREGQSGYIQANPLDGPEVLPVPEPTAIYSTPWTTCIFMAAAFCWMRYPKKRSLI